MSNRQESAKAMLRQSTPHPLAANEIARLLP
jgi:hypothetical protein